MTYVTKSLIGRRARLRLIGFRRLLFVASFLLLCLVLAYIYPNTFKVQFKLDPAVVNIQENRSQNPRLNTLIVSQPRSGSSFIGEIFNQHPNVFYMYEPLRGVGLNFHVDLYQQNATEFYNNRTCRVLEELMRCEFAASDVVPGLERFRRFSSRAFRSPPFCKRHSNGNTICYGLSSNSLQSVCVHHYNVTVMKMLLHRLPFARLDSLWPVCTSSGYNCRIIYLARDPRAVISSQFKLGFMQREKNMTTKLIQWHIERTCTQMELNVNLALNVPSSLKRRFMLVRFEDIAQHPVKFSAQLLAFSKLEMIERIRHWVVVSTAPTVMKKQGRMKSPFGLQRNSLDVISNWRFTLRPWMVNIIEENCASVMKTLGYKLSKGSAKILRDPKYSFYSNQFVV